MGETGRNICTVYSRAKRIIPGGARRLQEWLERRCGGGGGGDLWVRRVAADSKRGVEGGLGLASMKIRIHTDDIRHNAA